MSNDECRMTKGDQRQRQQQCRARRRRGEIRAAIRVANRRPESPPSLPVTSPPDLAHTVRPVQRSLEGVWGNLFSLRKVPIISIHIWLPLPVASTPPKNMVRKTKCLTNGSIHRTLMVNHLKTIFSMLKISISDMATTSDQEVNFSIPLSIKVNTCISCL